MKKREIIEAEMPITLEQLKDHVRVKGDSFNNQLDIALKAALYSCENFCDTVFMPSIFSLSIPFTSEIIIYEEPIIATTSLEVDKVVIGIDKYKLIRQKVIIDSSISGEDIVLRFKAGANLMDGDVIMAVLMQAAKFFANPMDAVHQLPTASEYLLLGHKKIKIG